MTRGYDDEGAGAGAGYRPQDGRGYDGGHDGAAGRPGGRPRNQGVPDALLVGLIGFLLGLTLVVWTATGLAGLLAHGGWPSGVTYTGTPLALRHLIGAPHDIAAAWPDAPKEQLSGYGLFWGLFVGELMVLLVLSIFVLGTVTRYRAVRATRRAERRARAGPAGRAPRGGRDGRADRPQAAPRPPRRP
ncbi:hypothetical protein O1L44_14020 [Streptomyces noursei]|nr:hypothetical protein [Streptomyces noursei]